MTYAEFTRLLYRLIHYDFDFVGGGEGGAAAASQVQAFVPNQRMNCMLAHKQNTVYLYGGLYEPGEKQVNSNSNVQEIAICTIPGCNCS